MENKPLWITAAKTLRKIHRDYQSVTNELRTEDGTRVEHDQRKKKNPGHALAR